MENKHELKRNIQHNRRLRTNRYRLKANHRTMKAKHGRRKANFDMGE